MQFQALSLLKLAVVAGLAYLSYRKTCQLKQLQRRVFVSPSECIIKEIGREEQKDRAGLEVNSPVQMNKLLSYDQFVSAYKDIPLLEMEEQSSEEALSPFVPALDLEKEEGVSTMAASTRRETSSVHSQLLSECEQPFFEPPPPHPRQYLAFKSLLRSLRQRKTRAAQQKGGRKHKAKISKQFLPMRQVERSKIN